MKDEIKLYSGGVLAGAYRGDTSNARTMLNHAVSDAPVSVGRLKRAAGEAFCNRKLDMVDFYGWQSVEHVTCPKCREILARLSK